MCQDYSNLQERRNISKLYMIARGYWFPVYGLGKMNVLNGIFYKRERDVPTKLSLGWNKVSECHTKLQLAFALAMDTCWSELERL